jgi:tetratricopeptide (TPR) repeat protein
MAQWRDALEILNSIPLDQLEDGGIREPALVLQVESRHELGQLVHRERKALFEELIHCAGQGPSDTRAKAALGAVFLAGRHRDEDLLAIALGVWKDIPQDDLDPRHLGKLLLSRAMASYHRREFDNGSQEATAGVQILESAGVRDTTYVRLLTGIGVIAAARGDYVAGVISLERAYEAAERLDNTPLKGAAAGNLALAYHRLGLSQHQLRWARLASRHAQYSIRGSYEQILASQQSSLAHHSLGHSKRARHHLESLRDIVPSIEIMWVKQAALLNAADLLLLSGREQEALDWAERAIGLSDQALSVGFAGKYARWQTIIALKRNQMNRAEETLTKSIKKLQRLDAFDKAEIVCCASMLRRRSPLIPNAPHKAATLIASLPAPCAGQMASVGLSLPNC